MDFYIASGFENKAEVRALAAALKASGHKHTYDWTIHDEPDTLTAPGWTEICAAEIAGVRSAALLIVILPGGRGTHTELGIAIGCKKQIAICAHDTKAFIQDEQPCPFYGAERVQHIWGTPSEWAEILKLKMNRYLNGFECIYDWQMGCCRRSTPENCIGRKCERYGDCEICVYFGTTGGKEPCDYCSHMPQQMWED